MDTVFFQPGSSIAMRRHPIRRCQIHGAQDPIAWNVFGGKRVSRQESDPFRSVLRDGGIPPNYVGVS